MALRGGPLALGLGALQGGRPLGVLGRAAGVVGGAAGGLGVGPGALGAALGGLGLGGPGFKLDLAPLLARRLDGLARAVEPRRLLGDPDALDGDVAQVVHDGRLLLEQPGALGAHHGLARRVEGDGGVLLDPGVGGFAERGLGLAHTGVEGGRAGAPGGGQDQGGQQESGHH